MEIPESFFPFQPSPDGQPGFSGLSPGTLQNMGGELPSPLDRMSTSEIRGGLPETCELQAPVGAAAVPEQEDAMEDGAAQEDGAMEAYPDAGEGPVEACPDAGYPAVDIWGDGVAEMRLVFGSRVCRTARERNLHVVRVPAPPVFADAEQRNAMAGAFRDMLVSLLKNVPAPPCEDAYSFLACAGDAEPDWDDPMELTCVLTASAEYEAERVRETHQAPPGGPGSDATAAAAAAAAAVVDPAHAHAAWNAQLRAWAPADDRDARARRHATLARVATDLETAARGVLDATGPAVPAAPLLRIAEGTVAHTVPCTATDTPATDGGLSAYDLYAKRLHRVFHDVSAMTTAVLLCAKDDENGESSSESSSRAVPAVELAPVVLVDYCGCRMLVVRAPAQTGLAAGAPGDVGALLARARALLARDVAEAPLVAAPEAFAARLAPLLDAADTGCTTDAAPAVAACTDTLLRMRPQLLCGAGSPHELATVLHARGLRMRDLGALHDALRARGGGADAATGARAREWAAVVAAEMLARAFARVAAAALRALVRARARDSALRTAAVDHMNALLARCVTATTTNNSSQGSTSKGRPRGGVLLLCPRQERLAAALWPAMNAVLGRTAEPMDGSALCGARHAVPHLFAVASARLGLVWDAALTAGVHARHCGGGAAFLARRLPLAPAQLCALAPRVVHTNAACHALGCAATRARPWPTRRAHATVAEASAAARAFLAAAAEQPWNGESLRRLARACEDAARARALALAQGGTTTIGADGAGAAGTGTGTGTGTSVEQQRAAAAVMPAVPVPAGCARAAEPAPVERSRASCVRHAQLHYALCRHARLPGAHAARDAAVFRAGVLGADPCAPAGTLAGADDALWAFGVDSLLARAQCTEALECCAARGAPGRAGADVLNAAAVACACAGAHAREVGAALLQSVLRAPDDAAVLANCAEYCCHVLGAPELAALFVEAVRRVVPDFSLAWLDAHAACDLSDAALDSLDF